ncbi:MAG TPA: Crp/Fnr family transcriptional regulator [Gaiellaceae bacterium]|nr:Crp/Fnr family transcriptional regulator [Gaiellaceae bacterium]
MSNSLQTQMEWELFAGVPEENVRRLLSIARRRTFGRGEVVFHRGDPADCLHLIVSGRFAVGITTPLGSTALLGVRGPGEAFGELALVGSGDHRSATVAALEQAETRSVLAGDFERLRHEYPSVDGLLVRLLGERVRRLSEQLTDAYYLPAETRVLRRLVELGNLYSGCIPLPQEQLAELAGTSRATANRVLRDLQRRGVLELGRSTVTVLEPEDLLRRSGVRQQ